MSKQKTALDLIDMSKDYDETPEALGATSELREEAVEGPREVRPAETIETIKAKFSFLKNVAELISFIKGRDLMATVFGLDPSAAYIALDFYRLFRDGYSRLERRDEFVQIGTYWESLSPLNVWGTKQGAVTVADFGCFKRVDTK